MTEQDIQAPYREAGRLLADLLKLQAAFIADLKLIADDKTINAKALGYVYGFADRALQIAKPDVLSPYGRGVLMFLIAEFDSANVDRLFDYLTDPANRSAFMDGVLIGAE